MVEVLLFELTEGARSNLLMLPLCAIAGNPGDMALLRGGDIGMRGSMARFDVLSINGVLRRAGGKKGEYACAGLGRFLFLVRGRESGVMARGSTSINAPAIWCC